MKICEFLQQHPVMNYADDFHTLCQPLNKLDIIYFSHAHIDEHQNMSAVASNADFFQLYFQKGYHHFDLHNANHKISEEFVVWDSITRIKESAELHQDFMSFNQGHTFSIVLNNKNSKDCFHFATRLGNESMNGRYLQLITPLKRFISYFKEKIDGSKQLSKIYDLKVPLLDHRGYITEHDDFDLDLFENSIKSKRIYSMINNNYLTTREMECLSWLAQGKTLEETAMILSITQRTVKAHVNSIKEKLGCTNQFQLGMAYAKLNESSK